MNQAVNPILEALGGSVTTSPKSIPAPSSSGKTGLTTSIEERALVLLGSGIQAEAVAAALGVSASRISQLLSEESFALRVATARYEALQKHNLRDNAYDELEDALINKLKKSLAFMIKPETILKAIAVINSAKRRGQSAPEQVVNQQNIVNLILPTKVIQQFSTDINNQVIKTGTQELLTMSSSALLGKLKETQERRLEKDVSYVQDFDL